MSTNEPRWRPALRSGASTQGRERHGNDERHRGHCRPCGERRLRKNGPPSPDGGRRAVGHRRRIPYPAEQRRRHAVVADVDARPRNDTATIVAPAEGADERGTPPSRQVGVSEDVVAEDEALMTDEDTVDEPLGAEGTRLTRLACGDARAGRGACKRAPDRAQERRYHCTSRHARSARGSHRHNYRQTSDEVSALVESGIVGLERYAGGC